MPIPNLPTNTTVSIYTGKLQPIAEMSNLPAFKTSSSDEIIAIREIPAALAFSFRFKDDYPITQFHFLMEGDTRYRVVGVKRYTDFPMGSHVRVFAEMKAGD